MADSGKRSGVLSDWNILLKMPALFLFILLAVFVRTSYGLIFSTAGALILFLLSGCPAISFLRSFRYPFLFLLFMLPLLVISAGGPVIFEWRFFKIYEYGLQWAGLISVRLFNVFLVMSVLLHGLALPDLLRTFHYYKIPPVLISIFQFTYRFIFLFSELLKNMHHAVRLRGYNAKNGLLRIRTPIDLIVNLLVRGYEQNTRTYQAMCVRGYNGMVPSRQNTSVSCFDVCKAVFVFVFTLIVFFGEVLWFKTL